MIETIRVGTRPSRLAIKQVEEIERRLRPQIRIDIVPIETEGDRDKITPLAQREGSDFFTYDIEKALYKGTIEAAVHSAKDLEQPALPGLVIAAMTASLSPFECLVSKNNRTLDGLPAGSRIGTSSRKRRAAVNRCCRDLIVKDIRGTIDERLKQLDDGDFDAIIIAHAALLRLGYEQRIAEIISPDIIEPHPLQGRLAVQVKNDRHDIIDVFRSLHDA
jgi:hydroxymethylbilane synthase